MAIQTAIDHLEVRWRVKDSGEAWGKVYRVGVFAEIVVERLDPEKIYEFEYRSVSACGGKSPWGSAEHPVPAVPAGTIKLADVAASAADAGTAAAAAQADADAANAALANIASDNLLTPGEKPTVIRDWNVISAEQAGIDAQATAYGITTQKTAYDSAVTALSSYLGTLTTPVLWSNLAGNTTIVGTTFRSKFADVYTTRQTLLNAIYAAAKSKADNAQSTANTAITNAANAASAAAAAQSDATAALAELDDIASDGKLTADEKVRAKQDYLTVTGEQSGIDAQATAYGITTEKSSYDSAITTLKTYLKTTVGVLDASYNWTGITGTTAITRSTWDSNWSSVYTTRQALLNAIYAAAKLKADAAQQKADDATDLASQTPVLDPNFAKGLTYWTPDGPNQGWFAGTGAANSPNPNVTTWAAHEGSGGTTYNTTHDPDTALRSNTYAPVDAGQVVSASAQIKGSVDTNGRALVRLSWRNAAQGEISVSEGNSITAAAGGTSRISAPAPAGARYVHVEVVVYSHASGYWYFNSLVCSYQPSSLDEVPDGLTKYGSIYNPATQGGLLVPGANLLRNPTAQLGLLHWPNVVSGVGATANFAQFGAWCFKGVASGDQGTLSDPIAMGVGKSLVLSAEMYTGTITGGTVQVFIQYLNGSGVEITRQSVSASLSTGWARYSLPVTTPAGTASVLVFMRASPTGGGVPYWRNIKLEAGTAMTPFNDWATQNGNELTLSGSGRRLGDARNQVMVSIGNYGAGWSGLSLSYTSTTTSATITASAATMQVGGNPVAYNQSSVTVSGTTDTQVRHYLYYDDAAYAGGSQTLHATTNQLTAQAGDGRAFVGSMLISFPASGTGSGTGSGPCPDENAWVLRADPHGARPDWPVRAKEVRAGHFLRLTDGRAGLVTYSERKPADRVRVTSHHHRTLTCSTSAPLELARADGECVIAPDSLGEWVRVKQRDVPASPIAAEVIRVEDAGPGYVQHITCQNACFWTGDDPGYLFGHHNMKQTT